MTDEKKLEVPRDRVVVDKPERQNLLGLLMRNILKKNLGNEANYARVRAVKGDVQVKAGEMVITLRFDSGQLTIINGPTESPRATVRGDMAALLGVVSGGKLVSPMLFGAIRIGGNPLLLLKILPLIRQSSTTPPDRSDDE